jgi:hypothetical protein
VIDYRSESSSDLSAEIASKGPIRYAFDAISEKGTEKIIANAMKEGGEKITHVLTYTEEELSHLPKNVEMIRTLVGTAHAEDGEFARKWYKVVGEWLEKGEFRGQKWTVVPGGLEGVKEGLRRLQDGEVKAEKLIYEI